MNPFELGCTHSHDPELSETPMGGHIALRKFDSVVTRGRRVCARGVARRIANSSSSFASGGVRGGLLCFRLAEYATWTTR